MTGLDNRAPMLALMRSAARDEGLDVETWHAEMTELGGDRRFAAAVNPLSSFRLLPDDAAMLAHLRGMAEGLLPGGLYVVDTYLAARPDEPGETTDEEWEMTSGDVTVRATNDCITVVDRGIERHLAWGDPVHLRSQTGRALEDLVRRAGGLEVAAWHPECARDELSHFDVAVRATPPPPVTGRTMVVLRRT